MKNNRSYQSIPSLFHSFHAEGPFTKCIECERPLLEDNCEYIIEKCIRNYPEYDTRDVIFDYAICMSCATKMHQEISRESLQSMRQYFDAHFDMEKRMAQLQNAQGDINLLTSHCMIKGTSAKEATEYQIYAHCVGDKISLQYPPYMVCGDVLEELSELISEKTRDFLNGFQNRHFSPDPGLLEPLPGPRILLI